MPRLLIVANQLQQGKNGLGLDWQTAWLASETGCSCMKFCSKGENNVHLVIPAKYDQGALQTIEDVYKQAADRQQLYDVIIVDTEAVGKEVMRLAERLKPPPAVLLYTANEQAAEKLRQTRIPSFCGREMLVDEDTRLCVFDAQMEKALGEAGLQRLQCKEGEMSASRQWLTEEGRCVEVAPAGVVRTPATFAGDTRSPG